MNNRSRNYSLVTYHSEEILKSVLLGASLIRHFVVCKKWGVIE